ncbi:DNA-processing protein DprA, partial [Nocardia sp. NPDC058497]|uniref:DNA-processing protein DprA n=1 Tax=Nocardia sp. NPDC058497 TaxID=3346529 RepID=UPI003654E736
MDPSSSADKRAQQLAWAILARAALTHRGAVAVLLAAQGPAGAADILAHATPGLTVRAGADVADANRIGARLITPEDPEWRRQLTEFDDPDTNRYGPVALWARGAGRLDALLAPSLAVVGARDCTDHGRAATHQFTSSAARQGWTIVTGGAFGVDTAVLEATLGVDGSAVVVTASGLSHAHPIANRELFEKVTQRGLLVSEYPPFDRPTRDRFLHRNRIIAALGRAGMVVPEAGIRSGTLNAADWANQLDRPVFALPTPTS